MRLGEVLCGAVLVSIIASLVTGLVQPARAAPLQDVQQNGSIRLCANPAALPYSDRSSQDSLPGFQIELAEAVAREMKLGLTVVWVQGPSAVRKANCDASMDSIALGAHHESEGRTGPLLPTVLPLRFTKPYAASGVFLVAPSDSSAHRFEDLQEQKIGVTVGSIEQEVLAKKRLRISGFAFQQEILMATEAGEIGAGAVASSTIGWYRHENPGTRLRIPDGYEPEPALRWNVAVGLWRADDALVDATNSALARVIEQRVPDQIYKKYGVTYHPPFPASAARADVAPLE